MFGSRKPNEISLLLDALGRVPEPRTAAPSLAEALSRRASTGLPTLSPLARALMPTSYLPSPSAFALVDALRRFGQSQPFARSLWPGDSGRRYEGRAFHLNDTLPEEPCVYVLSAIEEDGRWRALRVGQTDAARRRMSEHDKSGLMRHAHALGLSSIHIIGPIYSESERERVERDMKYGLLPPLNFEIGAAVRLIFGPSALRGLRL